MAPSKRKSRTLALQSLYEADVAGHPASVTLRRLVAAEAVADATAAFAEQLLAGVAQHGDEIDRVITQYAPQRPLDEIAAIDRNILRLAIYELLFDNRAPIAAVINEAVELAKRFGSEGSPRFVNGVLGSISGAAAQR